MSRVQDTFNMTAESWNQQISQLPGAHVLQTWDWGQFKAQFGWEPLYRTWKDSQGSVQAAALILRRSIPGGLSVLYIPRGPLLNWADDELRARVLDDVQSQARKLGAIFIKMDPEVAVGWGVPGSPDDREDALGQQVLMDLQRRGWRYSNDQIQFQNTVCLDLSGDETQWLARMKQKSRYNLRLSERKGVKVRIGGVEDFPLLYKMYAETSVRDGFVIRSENYYLTLWRTFFERGMAKPLIAEVEGEAVAGLILFCFAGRAWYLYGMSRAAHREKMPNYLLQWEAMRQAKAAGCEAYDLWGAPGVFDESDSMWGVFRFKEGLGGTVLRTMGAWDYTARPALNWLYTRVLPRILDVMRRRGKERTRQEVSL